MDGDDVVILRIGEPVPWEWPAEETEQVERPPGCRPADDDLTTNRAAMLTSDGIPGTERVESVAVRRL